MGLILLFLLKALAWGYYLLPSRLQKFAGQALGAVLAGLKLRIGVIRQNLKYAFPGETPDKISRRIRMAYAHLGQLVLEILLVLGPLKNYVKKRCILKGAEHWQQAKAQGKGVIFLTGHVGNWEVMSATGALLGGMDVLLITKKIKPDWLHKAIEKGRLNCGVRATYEPRTFRDVVSHLAKNGTVGFPFDQYTGPPVSVRVPVFGIPVGTSVALAMVAQRTGAVVLPVVNYRTADRRWLIEIRKPVPWVSSDGGNREIAENTARYAAELEKDIRAHPDQWLWSHRRFKGDLSALSENEWAQERARR